MIEKMELKLFTPVKIGSIEIKNRIAMSPICTNYSTEDGFVTNTLTSHYEERAKGGAGLIIIEATNPRLGLDSNVSRWDSFQCRSS